MASNDNWVFNEAALIKSGLKGFSIPTIDPLGLPSASELAEYWKTANQEVQAMLTVPPETPRIWPKGPWIDWQKAVGDHQMTTDEIRQAQLKAGELSDAATDLLSAVFRPVEPAVEPVEGIRHLLTAQTIIEETMAILTKNARPVGIEDLFNYDPELETKTMGAKILKYEVKLFGPDRDIITTVVEADEIESAGNFLTLSLDGIVRGMFNEAHVLSCVALPEEDKFTTATQQTVLGGME